MSCLAPQPVALHCLFAAGRSAEHPVCHDGQRLVLWAEFAGRVATLAAELAARPELRWLLESDDPLCFAVRLLALLYAGKEVVILPNMQAGTLAALADRFDARCAGGESRTAGVRGRLPAIAPEAAIIELWTSGSTGEAKRVRKTLAQFEAEVAVLEALWGATIGPAAMLATVPHQHIYGLLFRLFWPLASGRVFDTVTCAHPDTLVQRLAYFDAAVLVSSPAQLARLPELLPPGTLNSLKAVFSSGGSLPAAAASAFAQRFAQVPIEVYGSTETGGIAWRQQRGGAELWTPFPGLEVGRAPSGALALCSPFLGAVGSLLLDDAIELSPDGRFRLLGRLDRIVKIEEKRLSLPDMEARLAAHAWVAAAGVVALAGRRQSLGAVLVLNDTGRQQLATRGRRALAQILRRHLAAYFEAVLLPRHWRFPDQLPINERGKTSHAALAELFATEARRLPTVVGVTQSEGGDQIIVDLQVSANLEHFAGHFAGLPILPGVVQVDWAVRQARQHFTISGKFSSLENLKFQSLVLPDARVQLALKWDGPARRLEFSYSSGARKCSGGRIVFDGAE